MITFNLIGGFSIRVKRGKRKIDRVDPACWSSVEDRQAGLSEAQGVYIFITCDKKGKYTPWYVGRTNNFKKRISSRRNVRLLKKIRSRDKNDLQFFLIQAVTNKNNLMAKKIQSHTIKHLEQILIAMALRKNSRIINKEILIDETYVELRENLGILDRNTDALDAVRMSLKRVKYFHAMRKKDVKNALGM